VCVSRSLLVVYLYKIIYKSFLGNTHALAREQIREKKLQNIVKKRKLT
jgi:hypothetical protein